MISERLVRLMLNSGSSLSIVAYTDGSCWNTKKDVKGAREGGFGIVMNISDGISLEWNHISEGTFTHTTSARMEIRAVLRVLEIIPPGCRLQIFTDNQYVQKTIGERWIYNWDKHGNLQSRKNGDLWVRILKWLNYHETVSTSIRIWWVKGHDGHPLNEKADKLAGEGRINGKYIVRDCEKI